MPSAAPPPRFTGLHEGVLAGHAEGQGKRAGCPPPPPPSSYTAEEISSRLGLLLGSSGSGGSTAASLPGIHKRLLALISSPSSPRFPSRYRLHAWSFLLRLPGNEVTAGLLYARGPHAGWRDLALRFPIRDRRTLSVLSRALSALAHWSPVLGLLPFLPLLAYPFVRAWQAGGGRRERGGGGFVPSSETTLLETLMLVLGNWGGGWTEALPYPPIPTLSASHALLAHWDPQLAEHLERLGADPTLTLWPLLRSALSEVLPRGDWEALWDMLFARAGDPTLLLHAAIAYLRSHRQQLLSIAPPAGPPPAGAGEKARSASLHQLAAFLRHHAPTHMPSLFRLIVQQRTSSPACLALMQGAGDGGSSTPGTPGGVLDISAWEASCCAGPPKALPRGFYPAFLSSPRYITDAAAAERNRIVAEEAALAELKRAQAEMERQAAALKGEAAALRAQRAGLERLSGDLAYGSGSGGGSGGSSSGGEPGLPFSGGSGMAAANLDAAARMAVLSELAAATRASLEEQKLSALAAVARQRHAAAAAAATAAESPPTPRGAGGGHGSTAGTFSSSRPGSEAPAPWGLPTLTQAPVGDDILGESMMPEAAPSTPAAPFAPHMEQPQHPLAATAVQVEELTEARTSTPSRTPSVRERALAAALQSTDLLVQAAASPPPAIPTPAPSLGTLGGNEGSSEVSGGEGGVVGGLEAELAFVMMQRDAMRQSAAVKEIKPAGRGSVKERIRAFEGQGGGGRG